MFRRWTPSLRTVLVTVSLVILLLPLGGVVLFRLYESVQVRRTEAELIAQGAVVVAVYREELRKHVEDPESYGALASPPPASSRSVAESDFSPVLPSLDLARDPVLPDGEPPTRPQGPPDAAARAAGAVLGPLLQEVQKTTLAGIRVTDSRGTIIATTPKISPNTSHPISAVVGGLR